MKKFLDTSSLFKRCKNEIGSGEIEKVLLDNNLTGIFLSEITKLEFLSAVFKRVRIKDLSIVEAKQIIEAFEDDTQKYIIVPLNKTILDVARQLIFKYGENGLRTLDALQLSSAIEVRTLVSKYFSSDKLLQSLFQKENLPTLYNPE